MPASLDKISSKKSTAIVAGGAGFLGSFVCESLLSRGCQVLCVDNLLTGKKENIEHLLDRDGFFFIEDDINKPGFWQRKSSLPKINYIFHLASVEEYLNGKDISLETLRANSIGLENLLQLSLDNGARFLFCSSAEIISGESSASSLGQYFAGESFHQAKRFAENLVAENYRKNGIDARIIKVGQVYGPRMALGQRGLLSSFFSQTAGGGPIKIPGDGTDKIYPIYIADVTAGIIGAMFVPGTAGGIFDLMGNKAVSLLSFAEEIKKQSSPPPEIEFVVAREKNEAPVKESGSGLNLLGWEQQYSLEEGIRETMMWLSSQRVFGIEFAVESVAPNPPEKEKPSVQKPVEKIVKKGHKIRIGILIFLSVLVLLISPFIFLVTNLFFAQKGLEKIKMAARSGDILALKRESLAMGSLLDKTYSFFRAGDSLYGFIGMGEKMAKMEDSILLGKNLVESVYQLSVVADKGAQLFTPFLAEGDVIFDQKFSEMKLELGTAFEKTSLAQGIVDQFSGEEKFIGSYIRNIKEVLPEIRRNLLLGKEAMEIIPGILGQGQRKTYLIPFQNNSEIRPTGGFIGSFGLLTLENGRLFDFEVQDIYSADGQLRGYVEPPAKLKQYLGVSGWYLRDANWDPDFPTSASKLEWFFEKETGKKVDGVIGINLWVAQRILGAVGDIELSDYREKINADNFFEKAEYFSEAGFFPGSTQKKDFLGQVVRSVFERVKAADRRTQIRITMALLQSLEQKDILVSLHDEKAATLLSRYNWDGAVKQATCAKKEGVCFQDYLFIVEANLGVNKANYFLSRTLNHRISLADDGQVNEQLVIDYENKSPNNIFPAGKYKDYLRIYVTEGSVLEECWMGEEKCVLEEGDEHQRRVFGFLVEVPAGEKRQVKVSYHLPDSKRFNGGEFLLLTQKQSGMTDDPYRLTITYPDNLFVVWANKLVLTGKSQIIYNTTLSSDIPFEIGFKNEENNY